MHQRLIYLGFLLTLAQFSHQMTKQDPSNYYTAAVVEFPPVYKGNNDPLILRENTNAYIEYIEKASKQKVDIIVFPEDGLTSINMPDRSRMESWATIVPSALREYIPCTENDIHVSESLKRLSCAARENSIYVVINIAEKLVCDHDDGCHSNRTRYYNTNVVFDRTGKIIARYRKFNLYMEARFDKTDKPEMVTFDTDFGVKFGTFTCFDILFFQPALNLTRIQGITDIVFPTAWFSEVPFLTSVQTHSGWSFAEDVNLLAADYHQPDIGAAGSGIYLGRNGIANATMFPDIEHRLLIARVPKKTKSRGLGEQKSSNCKKDTKEEKTEKEEKKDFYQEQSASHALRETKKEGDTVNWLRLLHDNVATFQSIPLNVSMAKTICDHNFCCDFHVRTGIVDSSSTNYRAVVYNGVRVYGNVIKAGVRLCGLIQCSNDSILSCGFVGQSNTTFTTLSVTATFDHDYSQILTMPSVLGSSLLPFQHWTFLEHTYGKQTSLSVTLNEPTKNLVTFGIYSRDFTRDEWIRF